jgi:hypothetical protein
MLMTMMNARKWILNTEHIVFVAYAMKCFEYYVLCGG